MPKKKVSASVHAPSPADALIAKAQTKVLTPFPEEAREAMLKIFAHNDSCSRSGSGRVSRAAAVDMLREHFGFTGGEAALESACKRVFGRRTFGSP